jgi:hypothetical protein
VEWKLQRRAAARQAIRLARIAAIGPSNQEMEGPRAKLSPTKSN